MTDEKLTQLTVIDPGDISQEDLLYIVDNPSGAPESMGVTISGLLTYIESYTPPTGSILMWGTNTAPIGYLILDGSAVSRSTYSALFSLWSTTFGSGDGSTTFNLPDMRRRVPVGAGGTGSATLGNAIGNTGGEETHTLTTSEIPAHTHDILSRSNPTAFGTNARAAKPSSTGTADTIANGAVSVGGGEAHNNIQPSIILNFIVKT